MENKLTKAREMINGIDRKMAELFTERMKASELVAEHKHEHGLPILDPERERELIKRNSLLVENETYREYYTDYQKSVMAISRAYQTRLIAQMTAGETDKGIRVLSVNLGAASYPIVIGRGLIVRAHEFFNLDRRVLIVTDDGVPHKYAETISKLCKASRIKTVAAGEGSKSIATLEELLITMSDFEMSRGDCVVAVGGGVVGDLAGFAASVYMRGVDFYNVPTTLLSQVDSSIGGKTAVNLGSVKNSVGSFKQPCAVIVDADTLSTLPKRHLASGIAEAVKMAATSNGDLFRLFEKMSEEEIYNNIEEIITESLKIKKAVVEEDECEKGVRKILNFGHTLGHAIESAEGLSGLYHGECVALGMLAVTSGEVRERILAVLKKLGLPTEYHGDQEHAFTYLSHDKKCNETGVSVILCPKIGEYEIKSMSLDDFKETVINS